MKKPELLLPVGNLSMCLSAIHNGADAIYLGSPFFNARGRSKDHSVEELKEMIDLCHLYGVQVHVAFNILIFEQELGSAFEALRQIIALGVDAIIIQDIGLIQMVRKLSPDQIIHGSTQMSITNFEAIKLLDDLDIKRFVLGRENSLVDIKQIKENTDKEIEVFVHGALCVAYSGQCFTSESIGGRSANRGQCAQSCRFEYDLIVDGETKDLDGKKYLVSPKDLCGIDQVKELAELGVESLKVEGRLKSKDFVATAAKSYRLAIDTQMKSFEEQKKQMASTFSRGFYPGWLGGVAHQELVKGVYQDHRGQLLGVVEAQNNGRIILSSSFDLKNGDGLLFITKTKSVGSKIVHVSKLKSGLYEVKLLDAIEVNNADEVYLNSDESLQNEISKSIKDEKLLKRIPVTINIIAKYGEQLKLSFSDGINVVEAIGESELERAKSRPASQELIQTEVSKLSRTAFISRKIKVHMDHDLFINLKEIKKLKNQCVSLLNLKRIENKNTIVENPSFEMVKIKTQESSKKLNILVRKIEQLKLLVEILKSNSEYASVFDHVILDYEFGADFVKSVKLARENSIKVFIATTRILKPNEYHNFRLIERAKPDGILVRNLGALEYFKDSDCELKGDFSLNITNSLSFNYITSKGLSSQCLSYDLNKEQLDALMGNIDTSLAEITIYQYMPEFHMEHCVFAAFMSKGNSFRDCGKPCEKHEVAMKDMYGNMHELKADQECRNTMFSGVAQSSLGLVGQWQAQGVNNFRVEVLHELGDEFSKKIEDLLSFFLGKISENDVIINLKATEKYGLSTGQIFSSDNYQDIKIDDKNDRI